MIKRIIKFFIPKNYFYLYHATKEYLYDIKRFVKHSNTYISLNTQAKYEGYLTLQYHVIEKGLTMPETRLGFGKNVVSDLIVLCTKYNNKKLDNNSLPYQHTIKVLKEYLRFHEKRNFTIDKSIISGINKIAQQAEINTFGEQIEFSKKEYFKDKNAPFDKFCKSRFTARNFIEQEIPISTLMKCIELANESPSACNRQPSRVHIINNKETIQNALKLQSGNRGFGNLAQCLLIVTSDISVFQSHKERNEPAFNAGLFSMTLAYALHYNEIGSCMLNWSSSKENDMALRKLINIPDSEQITIILACGYLPDNFKIAKSPRLSAKRITYLN